MIHITFHFNRLLENGEWVRIPRTVRNKENSVSFRQDDPYQNHGKIVAEPGMDAYPAIRYFPDQQDDESRHHHQTGNASADDGEDMIHLSETPMDL